MIEYFEEQIKEVQQTYTGLVNLIRNESQIIIGGVCSFKASHKDFESIEDAFDIELIVPSEYPKVLPWVREVGGRIKKPFDHINDNGTLCLACPIETRLQFNKKPSLLGFIDIILVPYLYGFCYWEKYGKLPAGELSHNGEGVIEFYKNFFTAKNDVDLILGVERMFKYGYRGHHRCPCGSNKVVRQCHKELVLFLINAGHTGWEDEVNRMKDARKIYKVKNIR